MPHKSLFILIVGCGRLGSYLANRLSGKLHSVVVIDINESAFNGLSPEFSGFSVVGDATEFSILKGAKIDDADVFIATTRDDNINLMVSQIAKKIFHVPKVMARVFDPKRENIYKDFDIEAICPTTIAVELFLDFITESVIGTEKGNKQ
jgi:trk system potassium uptake protein TrkA